MEPAVGATLGAALRHHARVRPDHCLVDVDGRRLTFAGADDRADRLAAGLAARGVEPGERVAVISPNRLEVVELLLALGRLGAVQVPVNVYLRGAFLRHQLTDARAATVVGDAAGLQAVAPLLDDLPDLQRVVALDDAPDLGGVEVLAYEDLPVDGAPPAVEPDERRLDAILYTSGTTGMPKGCMLPHGYAVRAAEQTRHMLDLRPDDVHLTALPLYHGFARGVVATAVVHGMTVGLESAFSPAQARRRAVDLGATVLHGVGMMGQALLGLPPDELDTRLALRCAFLIPFDPASSEAFEARYGAPVLSQMYGQTECGAITFASLTDPTPPGTVGRPSPLFDVALLDDRGHRVEPGVVGEVAVRPKVAHAMYAGYWGRPEATVEAWRGLWHHTGDLARADADGVLTFVDRAADAVRRRGENVSSMQLEQAIVAHDDVAEAAVHAIPATDGEDEIKACVVAREGTRLEPAPLFDHFREQLPYFAIPRFVEVLDELPRTATMRVLKHRLRERGVTEHTWDLLALGYEVPRAERR